MKKLALILGLLFISPDLFAQNNDFKNYQKQIDKCVEIQKTIKHNLEENKDLSYNEKVATLTKEYSESSKCYKSTITQIIDKYYKKDKLEMKNNLENISNSIDKMILNIYKNSDSCSKNCPKRLDWVHTFAVSEHLKFLAYEIIQSAKVIEERAKKN